MKDRIKKIRKELDLTQQKMADSLGVQRNTIAMYEMGRTTPSDVVIKSICREFNVNSEWLISGHGEMFKASPNEALDALADEYGLSHGEYVLIEKFINLKAEKRQAVVEYVLDAAAAMQGEGTSPLMPAIIKPLDSSTATGDEKKEAYNEYIDTGKKVDGKSSPSNSSYLSRTGETG